MAVAWKVEVEDNNILVSPTAAETVEEGTESSASGKNIHLRPNQRLLGTRIRHSFGLGCFVWPLSLGRHGRCGILPAGPLLYAVTASVSNESPWLFRC